MNDDQTLVSLMSELARLLSRRSSTPRVTALRLAHRRIREFAAVRCYGEEWCDRVLMTFLGGHEVPVI
jgi:hypothetical protein